MKWMKYPTPIAVRIVPETLWHTVQSGGFAVRTHLQGVWVSHTRMKTVSYQVFGMNMGELRCRPVGLVGLEGVEKEVGVPNTTEATGWT